MVTKCTDCKKTNVKLTRHSKTGNHRPPYIPLCRPCHNERHGMGKHNSKIKLNRKVQRGTPYGKHKKR